MRQKVVISCSALFLFFSLPSLAQRADVDLDDDGLIEIFTLADLDAMRNVLDGSSFSDGGANINNNAGCAEGVTGVCHGYELMADLDFDSNGNGFIDHNDEFWNVGAGWQPIGNFSNRFEAVFDGNFFHIDNLTIFRPTEDAVGLIGSTGGNAVIRKLVLGGKVEVLSLTNVGALVGVVIDSQIDQIWVPQALIESRKNSGGLGGQNAGGLVGSTFGTVMISRIQVGGRILCESICGGLISSSEGATLMTDVLSHVLINVSDSIVGGLSAVGRTADTLTHGYAAGVIDAPSSEFGLIRRGTLNNAHWDLDTTGQTQATFDGTLNNTFGLTTAQMQCPVGPDDTQCKAGFTLYQNWDPLVWDFGTSTQYPVLIFNGKPLRDSDQDGVLDVDDPDDDNDGLGDTNDPNPFLINDSDGDGLPDGLEMATGTNPTLDDSDSDGLLDGEEDINGNGRWDSFETNPRVEDTDGDGNMDVALVDGDGDGLVDIHSLSLLNAVRFNLNGTGRTLSNGGSTNSVGCFGDESGGTPCAGYELQANLDFDTNGNGFFDADDVYWNAGLGWQPIGNNSNRFEAEFEGNFFHIDNLTIFRPTEADVGFFGSTGGNAVIRKLVLGGKVEVISLAGVGTLTGVAVDSQIDQIWVPQALVESRENSGGLGGQNAGGLVGSTFGTVMISHSQVGGQILCESTCGGLISSSDDATLMTDVLSHASVNSSGVAGGLSGQGRTADTLNHGYAVGAIDAPSSEFGLIHRGMLNNAHWDLDTTGQTQATFDGTLNNTLGLTTAEMRCPTGPDDMTCKPGFTLYQNWDSSIWYFGTETEYPVLRWTYDIGDLIFRDGFD